jgi:hypothetical protein
MLPTFATVAMLPGVVAGQTSADSSGCSGATMYAKLTNSLTLLSGSTAIALIMKVEPGSTPAGTGIMPFAGSGNVPAPATQSVSDVLRVTIGAPPIL